MSNKRNKKKWAVAATTLAAIAALAGTFAWFQSQDNATNHFEGDAAGNGDVEIVETFTPPTDWKPGEEINKDVAILNSGKYESMVRISFKETLEKLVNADSQVSSDTAVLEKKGKQDIYLMPVTDVTGTGTWTNSKVALKTMVINEGDYKGTYTLKAKEQLVTTNSGTTYRYASYWDKADNNEQYYAKVSSYTRASDGTITPATAEFKYTNLASTQNVRDWLSPIYKPTFTVDVATSTATINSALDGKITLKFVNLTAKPTANSWYYNASDGYFYYVARVGSQQQTSQILDSVKLDSSAGNEYSKFKYDLTVNARGIQAMKEVVNSKDWVDGSDAELAKVLESLFP